MTTIGEVAPKVAAGTITSEKLTENCLATIADLNPKLNAFITVTADQALARARQADKDIAGGRRLGPLHGIPISLKDLIDRRRHADHGGVAGPKGSHRDDRCGGDAPLA